MKHNPDSHHRRSIRLKGYDYSRAGSCFLTICTHHRKCFFGNIVAGKMQLNAAGKTAKRCWNEIPNHFPHVQLDEFVVMPNHVHGILVIMDMGNDIGAKDFSPLRHRPMTHEPNARERPRGTSKTLGSIVRGFKIGVTKWMRSHTVIHHVWQRNYWEHIIRNEPELNRILEYVRNNPAQWETDRLNPRSAQHRGERFFAPTTNAPTGEPAIGETSPEYQTESWMI